MVNPQLLSFYLCKYCSFSFADFSIFKNHLDSHEIIYRKFWLTRGQGLACKCGYVVQGSGLRTHSGCHFWNSARRMRSRYFAYAYQHPQKITSLYRRRTFKSKPVQSTPLKYDSSHSQPQHECPHCGYGFRKLENLKRHVKVHTGETNYKCKDCSRHFVSNTGLQYHRMSKHLKNKPFKCDLCGYGFIKYQHMERHKRTHLVEKPFKCKVCDKSYITNSNLKVHERTHLGIKQFHCKYCGRGFWQKGHMKDHMLGHGLPETLAKCVACDICNRTFLRKKNLRDHYRTHTGEKPHICSNCGQGFATSSLMLRHMKGHLGKLPYTCDQCKQNFATLGNVRRHIMRYHTGVKPYMCETCNKGFAFITDLRKHEHCHLPDSAKPMKCTFCNKGYSTQSKLNTHLKVHTGERNYECEYVGCNKAFATSGQRSRHHHTHTGARNYKCTKCDKAFSQPGNLKRHLRNHAGVLPYRCFFCKYRSAEKGNLKRHVKYKHPSDFTDANLAILMQPVTDDFGFDVSNPSKDQNVGVENLEKIVGIENVSVSMDVSMQYNVTVSPVQLNNPGRDGSDSDVISKYLPSLNADNQRNITNDLDSYSKPRPLMSETLTINNNPTALSVDFQNEEMSDLNSDQVLPSSLVSACGREDFSSLSIDVPNISQDSIM